MTDYDRFYLYIPEYQDIVISTLNYKVTDKRSIKNFYSSNWIQMIDIISYSLGHPFPDERYISSEDRVAPRITPHSFDVIVTLDNLTDEERKALVCDKFHVSIFVHKQIPHIIFDFGVYKFNVSINIQKINSVNKQDWVYDEETAVTLYLLEPVTGNIINFRMLNFPLIQELKYLLRLQLPLTKETIDSRAKEAEQLYSIQDMENYSIFYGEVPESGITINSPEEEYIF